MIALFTKFKTVIIVFAVIILAFIAYSYFGPKPSQQSGTALVQQNTNSSNGTTASDGPGTEFVSQLLAIQNIHFNTAIFADPAYQSLQDFSRPLIPQPIGRPNPFAPLTGSDATIASSTNASEAGFINTSDASSTSTTTKKATTTIKKK